MEERGNSSTTFDGIYNTLTCQEDTAGDEQPLYSNQDKHQVSMSLMRPEAIWHHYRLLVICLVALASFLLAVDIGLGVYYSSLSKGPRTVTDLSREVLHLQVIYNAAVKKREEAKKLLAKEMSLLQLTKWEIDHHNRRTRDYKNQADKVQSEVAVLKSTITMIKDGCRHCPPSWAYMHLCYNTFLSESIVRGSWNDARQFCKKLGADLAVIDSKEKQLNLMPLISHSQDNVRSGFWIGLTDVEEDREWRWLDGTRLTEGFWMDGEPGDIGDGHCVAMYPRFNPFKNWKVVPCSYSLKWICEMRPF